MGESKYHVGDYVWASSYSRRAQQVQCPTCFGKREVTLILGDGTHVALPCAGCGHGFNEPRGTITAHVLMPRADGMPIASIRTEEGPKGTVVEYHSPGCRVYAEDDIYLTLEEALLAAEAIAAKAQTEEDTKAAHIKERREKSFAWNATYHLRSAKDCRKSAERHEKLARLCKERVRPKKEKADA